MTQEQTIQMMYDYLEPLPLVDYGFGLVEPIKPPSEEVMKKVRKNRDLPEDEPIGVAFGEIIYGYREVIG